MIFYVERFKTMTRLWRKMWRQGDDPLPMYTVELPGYSYGDVNGTNAADFRAAQHQIAHELENSGCVSTTDLILPYEAEQIHGCRKKEICRITKATMEPIRWTQILTPDRW